MIADPKGLGAMFDAHTAAEFKTRDIEATMATMSEAPHVTHVPTMTGGSGREAVRRFYEVTIPFVVVVGFKDGRIEFERIYWDQASMLVQLGLIDSSKLPVSGAEQAARLMDPSLPSNTLISKR